MAAEFSDEFRSYRSLTILRISRTKHVNNKKNQEFNFEINTPEIRTET